MNRGEVRRIVGGTLDLLLPYQREWLLDDAELRICVKSRQIGGTWTEALRRVLTCLAVPHWDHWWISRDDKQAREFVEYIRDWVRIINALARRMRLAGVQISCREEYMGEDEVKVRQVLFANRSRIMTLTSNPDAARGNAGDLGIDEYASHKEQARLWRTSKPIITTGGNLAVISTHDGPGTFADLVDEAQGDNPKGFSLHVIPITLAVEQGYVDQVVNPTRRRLGKGPVQPEVWLQQLKDQCIDEVEWQQEYMCVCVREAYALLGIDLIEEASWPWSELRAQETRGLYEGGTTFLGMDIGRHRDLTVYWVITRVQDRCYTREVLALDQADYDTQEHELDRLMRQYQIRHAVLDATTKGEQLAERAQGRWGQTVITPLLVHSKSKAHLAPLVKVALERRAVVLPADPEIREDLHRVEKQIGEAGAVRYVAPSTPDGHSDRFFALALALEAAGEAELLASVRMGRREPEEAHERGKRDSGGRGKGRHSKRKQQKQRQKYGGF